MLNDWPERMQDAQRITTCWRDGRQMARVRYGEEIDDWGANEHPCGDCGVCKGAFHVPGCDVEQCPACGAQIIGCDCTSSKRPKKAAKPFSAREQNIVAERRLFAWRHIGFSENGNAVFEVENRSRIRLPFISIGVQGRGGAKLIGGAWLDVSGIEPGAIGTVEKDCYKDLLGPDEVEFFTKPDPTPETRDRFWEFQRLAKA